MSSQCVFADFADCRKGDGAGEILHRLSADDDVGADPNPIGGWRGVHFGDATAHAGARRPIFNDNPLYLTRHGNKEVSVMLRRFGAIGITLSASHFQFW